ncbi:MAG: cytochrome c maturation protein CcmE [Rhodospirillales bacterium]
MKPKHRRLTFVIVGLGLLGAAVALVLSAIDEAVVFFRSPTELVERPELGDRRVRIGGLVEEGSVDRGHGTEVRFRVTDLANAIPVRFDGILPDLFREGQGVVAEGRMQDGVFVADGVLAKHDENYMPPEVAAALKKSGQWQHMRKQLEETGQIVEDPPR